MTFLPLLQDIHDDTARFFFFWYMLLFVSNSSLHLINNSTLHTETVPSRIYQHHRHVVWQSGRDLSLAGTVQITLLLSRSPLLSPQSARVEISWGRRYTLAVSCLHDAKAAACTRTASTKSHLYICDIYQPTCARLGVWKTTTNLHPVFFASTTDVILVNPEEVAPYTCDLFVCTWRFLLYVLKLPPQRFLPAIPML